MQGSDSSLIFRYPFSLRYLLRSSIPLLITALFVFTLSSGWTSEDLPFGVFCTAVALSWWWFWRRYDLTLIINSEGITFIRGRVSTVANWTAITTVRFSPSGVRITADGKTWHVGSDLSGWDQFRRLLQDRTTAEALAAWLKPPFTVRTTWLRLLQPMIGGTAFFLGGIGQLMSGQGKAGLVMLGVGGLFLFLLQRTVLWYRFNEDALIVQRLTGRERHPWNGLQFATIKDTILGLLFADGDLVGIDGNQIHGSLEDIFLSMQGFWEKHALSNPAGVEHNKTFWSWPRAVFWYTIVPLLVLVTFPIVLGSLRTKLGSSLYACENTPAPTSICQTLRQVQTLLYLDIAVLGFMVAVATAIYGTSEYCHYHRHRLLTLFRPALVLVIASTLLIMASQSVLLAALLYYVPWELANLRLSGLLIVVGIGLVLGIYHLLCSAWNAVRPKPLEVEAVSVLPAEQPGIWELATHVARSLGAPPPDQILLGLEPNYFVTEFRLSANAVPVEGYSLYLSVPATRLLTEPELRAILGHEFGHFRGTDTEFSKRFSPLYSSMAKALTDMAHAYGSWTLLPALYLLQFFLVRFGKVESALRREREFLADNAAAEQSSCLDLASALVKLELSAPTISTLVQECIYTDRAVTPLAEKIGIHWPEKIRDSLLAEQTSHPFDSHPPLGSRLRNLGINLEMVLAIPMADGAAHLFQDPDTLEVRLVAEMRSKAEALSLSRRFTFVPGVCHTEGKMDEG